MAIRIQPGPSGSSETTNLYPHVCELPWPVDPTLSEGHECACGRRWAYLPAHWEPLYTLEELRDQQRSGSYTRSCL
jgi:hypothetical protein